MESVLDKIRRESERRVWKGSVDNINRVVIHKIKRKVDDPIWTKVRVHVWSRIWHQIRND